MSDDLSAVEFMSKLSGEGKWPATMSELVDGWMSFQEDKRQNSCGEKSEFFWASLCAWEVVIDHADLGLNFVLAALAKKPDRDVLAVLAAGPLEDALAYHGQAIIDRVEEEARRSPEFRHLLGGVWQNQTPDEIWQRVLKVAPDRW